MGQLLVLVQPKARLNAAAGKHVQTGNGNPVDDCRYVETRIEETSAATDSSPRFVNSASALRPLYLVSIRIRDTSARWTSCIGDTPGP